MNKKERQLAYERERKAMNDLAMREFDRERAIEAIHKEHIETIQEQIDGFYMRYACPPSPCRTLLLTIHTYNLLT